MQVSVRIEKWNDLEELIAFITKIMAFKDANPSDNIKVVF